MKNTFDKIMKILKADNTIPISDICPNSDELIKECTNLTDCDNTFSSIIFKLPKQYCSRSF